jgi:hypothetical protein
MKTNNFKFHFCPITVIIHPLNTGMLISDDEEEELTLKWFVRRILKLTSFFHGL